MSDKFEDESLEGEDASFDDFEKKQMTLGDLWRNNPMVKIGVIVGGVVLVLSLIFMFGGRQKPVNPSYVSEGSEVKAAPGTEETSPAYVAAVQEQNEARTEEAFKGGGSALPTPIEPPLGTLEVTKDPAEAEDPLQRWRKLQEERMQRELQKTQTVEDAPELEKANQQNQAAQAIAEVMSEQMQAILESKSAEVHLQTRSITDSSYLAKLQEKQEEALRNTQNSNPAAQEILVPAGQIAYAQLITEANSDVPAPILAQIVSGPLRGKRILGSFAVQEELLTLTFNTVVIDGISQTMNAIALDPKTTLAGMATDVDHKYFTRIILPAAAAFVEGAANAISESGLTTITIQGDSTTTATDNQNQDQGQKISAGVEEAGQELRQVLEEQADNAQVLVRIRAGTPMGILFLESVLKPDPALIGQQQTPPLQTGEPDAAGSFNQEAIAKAIASAIKDVNQTPANSDTQKLYNNQKP